MSRVALTAGALAALALAVDAPAGGGGARPLPLQAPAAVTPSLLALTSDGSGSRLVQLAPASFAPLRHSARLPVGTNGWALSPDGKLLAIGTYPSSSDGSTSTLRFANATTLRWTRRGVRVEGYLVAASWPRPDRVYALTGSSCCSAGIVLDAIDTVAKRVVARTELPGQVAAVARSASGLVALGQPVNAIGPATLHVVGRDGALRSVRLDRILAGTHVDESSRDPLVTTRQPGLAVDTAAGTAYVLDPGGLVAEIRLADLAVTYHELGRSLLARLAGWLAPAAQAKGLDGPALEARWLGDGLIAVFGTENSTSKLRDGSSDFSTAPAGLRIVDTRDWSERMLDPKADTAAVADGLLLATGGAWHSGTPDATTGEGLAAYGPDGALRWRLDPGTKLSIEALTGTRALVQAYPQDGTPKPLQLVDLASGRVVRTLAADTYPWPLLGTGS